jgi:hypothetical protein
LKATKKTEEPGATQVAILLTAMGKEAVSVFKTFAWPRPDDKDDLTEVLKAFTIHTSTQRPMKSKSDSPSCGANRERVSHLIHSIRISYA